MSQKGFAPILILIILAVLTSGGYFVYQKQIKTTPPIPFPQPTIQPYSNLLPKEPTESEKKLRIQKTANLEQTIDWKIYKDDKYSIQVKYPTDWVIKKDTKILGVGDLITFMENTPQQNQSEYYNTAIFTIGIPQKTDKDAVAWVKERYADNVGNPSFEISSQTINGLSYQKVFICGLGCFNYYHTKVGDFLYSFSLTYSGTDEVLPEYEQKLINILYTVGFTP